MSSQDVHSGLSLPLPLLSRIYIYYLLGKRHELLQSPLPLLTIVLALLLFSSLRKVIFPQLQLIPWLVFCVSLAPNLLGFVSLVALISPLLTFPHCSLNIPGKFYLRTHTLSLAWIVLSL